MKNYPSGSPIAIRGSFTAANRQGISSGLLRNFNEPLPPQPRGLYIGAESGNVYTVWIIDENGNNVVYYNMVPGIVHPIYPATVLNRAGAITTADNILVLY